MKYHVFRQENEERKRNLDEINKWIKDENEKRMAEAEALRIRMEREKAELREFMERDNKAMQVLLQPFKNIHHCYFGSWL